MNFILLNGDHLIAFNRALARFFLFFLTGLLFSSCMEDNFANIKVGDSMKWEPSVSVPVGRGSLDVNNFFDTYQLPDSVALDSLPVFYEDSLYYISQIRIVDTFQIAFSMSNFSEERDYINRLAFRFTLRNGYPTKTESQVYFKSGTEILDSLFTEKLEIPPGNVDENQEVSQVSFYQKDIPFDSARIDELYKATEAVFWGAVFVTRDELSDIRFYKDYEVHVQMGVKAELNIVPSDFN